MSARRRTGGLIADAPPAPAPDDSELIDEFAEEEAGAPTKDARLPPPVGRARLLIVLPKRTIARIHYIADKLNTTYSSVVHMAVNGFYTNDPNLENQLKIEAAEDAEFQRGGPPREGG